MHVCVYALALDSIIPSRADPLMEVKNIAPSPGQVGHVVRGGLESWQLYFCLGFLMCKMGTIATSQQKDQIRWIFKQCWHVIKTIWKHVLTVVSWLLFKKLWWIKPQDSQKDKIIVTVTKYPLDFKDYVLRNSVFNRDKAPYFPALITRVMRIVGRDL